MKSHFYQATTTWTGNTGEGTRSYRGYSRDHEISMSNKTVIAASSDPVFRGNSARHNPEELFLGSLSSCHMLWVLHLCTVYGVVILEYVDYAEGIMTEEENGSGRFTSVTLKPEVVVERSDMIPKLDAIHHEANKKCFIANSCNFPVRHKAIARVVEG
jgi:organic hydroperoxide reductase OsmC/OhrA